MAARVETNVRTAVDGRARLIWDSIPKLLGLVLLAAAALKGYELATGPVADKSFWTSRWFLIGLVESELALGLWLVSGLYRGWARLAAVVCFFVFLQASLHQGVSGEKTCGCFRTLPISPWSTFAFDCAALVGLGLARGKHGEGGGLRGRRGRALLLAGFFLVAIPGLMSMAGYRGVIPMLRRDPFLNRSLALNLTNPEVGEIVEKVRAGTGVNLTIDESVSHNRVLSGEFRLPDVTGWALMELLTERQLTDFRWVETDDGYSLVPRLRLRGINHWIVGALLVAVSASILLLSRRTIQKKE